MVVSSINCGRFLMPGSCLLAPRPLFCPTTFQRSVGLCVLY